MPDAAPPISAIHTLSFGQAEQHWEHRHGSRLPALLWALFGRRWVPLPILSFVIAHRDGPVLFDAGLDPRIVSDPGYIRQWIGRFLLKRLFRLAIGAEHRLDRQLAALGIGAEEVRLAAFSHLHFDHVGGIAHIPQAELIASAAEWAVLQGPHPEREWILREHIEIPGARWRPVAFAPSADPLFEGFAGVHDLAGDGSMILLPTPGHTPGSLSMLIRREGWAPILLIGDLAYEAALLERDQVAGTGDAAALRRSYALVRGLRERLPGLALVASHDFAAPGLIDRAMGAKAG